MSEPTPEQRIETLVDERYKMAYVIGDTVWKLQRAQERSAEAEKALARALSELETLRMLVAIREREDAGAPGY